MNENYNKFSSPETAGSKESVMTEHQSNDSTSEDFLHTQIEQNQLSASNPKVPVVEELYDSDAEETTQENVGNIDTLLDDENIENRNSSFTCAPGDL